MQVIYCNSDVAGYATINLSQSSEDQCYIWLDLEITYDIKCTYSNIYSYSFVFVFSLYVSFCTHIIIALIISTFILYVNCVEFVTQVYIHTYNFDRYCSISTDRVIKSVKVSMPQIWLVSQSLHTNSYLFSMRKLCSQLFL